MKCVVLRRTSSRVARYGETAQQIAITPFRESSLATYPSA